MNPTNRGLAIGFAVVLAWTIFLISSGRMVGGGPMGPPSLEVRDVPRPINFDWTLQDPDGNPVKFADFKDRPIVLNIWATWCGPCRTEMPSLSKLAENPRVKAKNVAVLCVSVDSSPAEVKAFLKANPGAMTTLWANSPLPPAFQTEAIPATFLISPKGGIVSDQVGSARWDDPSVIEFLEKLSGK